MVRIKVFIISRHYNICSPPYEFYPSHAMPCVAWDLTLWRSASRKIDTGRVYSAQINIRYNTQMNTFHDSMSITTTGILKETNSGLICLKTVYLVVNSIDVDTHVVATHELLVAVRTRNVWEVARFACHAAIHLFSGGRCWYSFSSNNLNGKLTVFNLLLKLL